MFKNIKLKTKIISVLLVILVLNGVIQFGAISNMKTLNKFTVNMYNHPFTVSNTVKNATINILKMHNETKHIVEAPNNSEIERLSSIADSLESSVYEDFALIDERFLGDKKMITDALDEFKSWKVIRDRIITESKNGNRVKAELLLNTDEMNKVGKILAKIKELDDFAQNKAQTFFNNANEKSSNAINLTIIESLLTSVFALLLSILIVYNMSKKFNLLEKSMSNLSSGDGDLTKRINITGKDEFARVASHTNLFIQNIQSLVERVKSSSADLQGFSKELSTTILESTERMNEISHNVDSVSEGTQNNASTLEEANASIQTIASNTELVAKETSSTFEKSSDILHSANIGMENINELIDVNGKVQSISKEACMTISELKKTSLKVGEIISLIDNISEQTNLLALNASIEAARAGDAGRGFAVVADEVRKLAEESKASTVKISELIYDIQEKAESANTATIQVEDFVEISVTKANTSHSQFKNIRNDIEDITHRIEMVSTSSSEQARTLDEMSLALEEISNSSQTVAHSVIDINSSVEDSTVSLGEIHSESALLENLTDDLRDLTDKFKV